MNPSGFFVLHIGEPERGFTSDVDAPVGDGGSDREEAPQSGCYVRFEWIEGKPCITDMGNVQRILVNSAPIEPHTPFYIQVGDTITIANVRLTWNAPPEVGEPIGEAVVVPVEAVLPSQPPPSEPVPVYNLVIQTPQWTKELPLKGKVMRIGRAPDNDIHIDDSHVSRYHAQIVERDFGFEIVDLGSVNGLRFKNERISRKLLIDGDVVWVSKSISLTCRVTQPPVVADAAPKAIEEAPELVEAYKTVVIPKQAPGQVAAATPDETVVVPMKAVEPSKPATPAEIAIPSERIAEPPKDDSPDKTVVVPKRKAGKAKAAAQDETVVPSREAIEPSKPVAPAEPASRPVKTAEAAEIQAADKTVVVPKKAAGPAETPVSDKTVVVPKRAVESPTPQVPDETSLAPGKTVASPDSEAMPETAWMDMAQHLERDTDHAFVSTTIIRNTEAPHLVIHLPDRTWEVQFTQERMTVGRGEDNDIPVPDASVSRRHASIERRGDDFVIRETQSRNGIWLGKQRIEEHTLKNGDILSLGRAKLMFKSGFTRDDLTLIGPPRIDGKPARRPVLFVPGFGGSELWLGSERLWPNPKHIISNPEIFSLPGDPRIEARGIVSDVVIVPNIIKQEQYSRLGDYLEAGLGYTRGKDLLEFAYDWRQDIRLASQRLAETVERWQVKAPITIIAHSLGTLVTRYYVQRMGGKRFVERIVLMGGPHYGAPKGLSIILVGPGLLPFGVGDERMRSVIAAFPSAYQILPIYPCVTDQNGQHINVLQDESWLPERQRPYLRAARSFRRELGHLSSVPSVSIFGYGLKTMLRVKIDRRSDGQWEKVDFVEDTAGDLSVPSGSAVLKKSEIHPVFQEHGSLYVDDDVKMRLKVELTRSTTWQRKKRR